MSRSAPIPARIIGIGNEFAGDDAVGLLVTRRLRSLLGGAADVIEAGPAGLDLLDLFDRSRPAVLIDAVVSGAPPGTIHRVDLATEPVPRTTPCSTHAFSMAEVLELARVMERVPASLVLYGIEIDRTAPGMGLSPAVERAVEEAARRIVGDVGGGPHA